MEEFFLNASYTSLISMMMLICVLVFTVHIYISVMRIEKKMDLLDTKKMENYGSF